MEPVRRLAEGSVVTAGDVIGLAQSPEEVRAPAKEDSMEGE